MKIKYILFLALFGFSLTSCIKDEVDTITKAYTDEEYTVLTKTLDLPVEANEYSLELPPHLGSSRVNSNKHQATLGRVLFYDKKLSKNETTSCASCHSPKKAFADGKAFSEGFEGKETKRNSLALGAFPSFNAYYGFGGTRMFWDERAATVAEQSKLTIKDPVEMGNHNLDELADQLLQIDYYKILFEKAYPPNNFNSQLSNKDKMLQAIDAFVSSIGCFNTRFDEGWASKGNAQSDFSNFTAQENRGKLLFNQNCAACHNLGPGFSTTITSANNGLDLIYDDKGRFEVTHLEIDKGVFKVPMLRNVALTAPYMHDGRFETLEEVIEHYNSGVKNHPNLHPRLRDPLGNPKHLNLNQEDKDALVAFLHTLTDTESIAQIKYTDPFKK